MECMIHVTARLRNCGYSAGELIHDTLKHVFKFICFTYQILSIIYWDIHAFRSVAPHKVDPHNDCSARRWNGKGEFSEDADGIVAFIPQQRMKRQQYSQGL
jgi:hypothetical protein